MLKNAILFAKVSISLLVCLLVCLLDCLLVFFLSVCLSVCLLVCLFVCLLLTSLCSHSSGLLILLNTFSAPVLFALGLPLLLFWPQIQNRLLGTGNKNAPQSSKGEFDWIESPELLRTRMFRLVVMYQALHGFKVLKQRNVV